MDNVPVEVLEQIFTNLTSLKDIGNCMQICQKWKNILTVMIKDRFNQNVKVLVVTGKPEENGAKIEVIDLIDPKWKHVGAFHIRGYPESQLSRTSGSTGVIYNDKVIICGGTSGWSPTQKCFIFPGNIISNTAKQFVMRQPRFGAKSVIFYSEQDGKPKLWVIGGFSSHGDLNSTELIRPFDADPEFTQQNRFLFTIANHTVVKIDPNIVYIIGGTQYNTESNQTWTVDTDTQDFNTNVIHPNPSCKLKHARSRHSCGKMTLKNGNEIIIVAGGKFQHNSLDSVEILEPLLNNSWIIGPKLPFKVYDAEMITSPNGHSVVLIGGNTGIIPNNQESDVLLELSGDSIETLKWNRLDQKLSHPRYQHLAFLISEDLFDEMIIKEKTIKPKNLKRPRTETNNDDYILLSLE